MGRRRKWDNEEMWRWAVSLHRGGLTYSAIEAKLANSENMRRFGLKEVPHQDTVRREVQLRMLGDPDKSRAQDRLAHQTELVDWIIGLRNRLLTCVRRSPTQVMEDFIRAEAGGKGHPYVEARTWVNPVEKNAWEHLKKSDVGEALRQLRDLWYGYAEACNELRHDLSRRLYQKTKLPIVRGPLDLSRDPTAPWTATLVWPLAEVELGGDESPSYLGEFIIVPVARRLQRAAAAAFVTFHETPNHRAAYSERVSFKAVKGDRWQALSGRFVVGLVRAEERVGVEAAINEIADMLTDDATVGARVEQIRANQSNPQLAQAESVEAGGGWYLVERAYFNLHDFYWPEDPEVLHYYSLETLSDAQVRQAVESGSCSIGSP